MRAELLAIALTTGCSGEAVTDSSLNTVNPAETAMTSPRMAESYELAGYWRLTLPDHRSCLAHLSDERLVGRDGWRLELVDCPDHSLLAGLEGWTPTPNGLAILGADGLTALDFETTADGELTANRGHGVVLRRRR